MTHGSDEPIVETWPQLLEDGHQPPDENLDLERLVAIWRGEDKDAYAVATITGTIAMTLRTMGKAETMEEAEALGREVWAARDRDFLPFKG